jgi:hypothetical protein
VISGPRITEPTIPAAPDVFLTGPPIYDSEKDGLDYLAAERDLFEDKEEDLDLLLRPIVPIRVDGERGDYYNGSSQSS